MSRTIHLALHPYGVGGPGQHGLWKDPRVGKNASIDINYYIAAGPGGGARPVRRPVHRRQPVHQRHLPGHYLNRLEPLTLLSAVATHTQHIGLVGTASSTYNSPFNLARRFASLDHISGGRAGLERGDQLRHRRRPELRAGGTPRLRHPLRPRARVRPGGAGPVGLLRGRRLPRRRGARPVPRPGQAPRAEPRGRALPGRRPAQHLSLAPGPAGDLPGRGLGPRAATSRRRSPKASTRRAARSSRPRSTTPTSSGDRGLGRDPEHIKIFIHGGPVVAATNEAAQRRDREIYEEDNDFDRTWRCSAALSGRTTSASTTSTHRSRTSPTSPRRAAGPQPPSSSSAPAPTTSPCVRSPSRSTSSTGRPSSAAPETVADTIEQWFAAGTFDGINLAFRTTEDLELFVDGVVPILQTRGLFRTEYKADTLRGNLGLPVPANRYAREHELASV